jgi:MYXO-CTERM domain-containing protein
VDRSTMPADAGTPVVAPPDAGGVDGDGHAPADEIDPLAMPGPAKTPAKLSPVHGGCSTAPGTWALALVLAAAAFKRRRR